MSTRKKRVSVFGMGYVGSVTAACLADGGHSVTGVDSNPTKVGLIAAGKPPVIEADLEPMIAGAIARGNLRATHDAIAAVHETDLSIICVGTPSGRGGGQDLGAVERVCREIGGAIATLPRRHTVVIRSTVAPGTMRRVVIPALEQASGRSAGTGFGVANNPEFLREGSAVDDFRRPSRTVIGSLDEPTADEVASLYADIDSPVIRTSVEVAELVKYADNSWHALKVAYANEIGTLCKSLEVDSHEVMAIFCQDRKLNISPAYLKPGFAFGGSCLPKDLRTIVHLARKLDLELPVLTGILPSNRLQIERAVEMVAARSCRRIGVLGFSFKAGTDDLRESPLVELIERLIGKGYDLRLYDRNVRLSQLVGANREYLLHAIPHISTLMLDSIDDVLAHSELVIVGNNDPAFRGIGVRLGPPQQVLDLTRVVDDAGLGSRYDGFNW
jgi:GDP-mannose 6-dehydrogenase